MLQDLRYALRAMIRNKVFTALAVLSLALGIGANTAIFSFLDGILLRSLPVHDPDSLVTLNLHTSRRPVFGYQRGQYFFYFDPDGGYIGPLLPLAALNRVESNPSVLSAVFAYSSFGGGSRTLMFDGQAGTANAELVSGGYFSGLGVAPVVGRFFNTDDDRTGAPGVLILSFELWQSRFGGSADAIGKTAFVDNRPFTIAGVAPSGFYGPEFLSGDSSPDFYLPLRTDVNDLPASRLTDSDFYWIEVAGRLRPGVTIEQAQAALSPMFHQMLASQAPTDAARKNLPKLSLRPGGRGSEVLRIKYGKPVYVLIILVALILAIACANLANLLLARAAGRRREIAVRLSVGAGRWRMIRQLLTESLLLASLGGALGVLVAIWGVRFVTALLGNGQGKFTMHADLNWHVLAAAIALSILTGILFGLAPAIQSTRVDVIAALKQTQTVPRRGFLRVGLSQILIVSQMAVSVLLLIAAGLFVRSLSNLDAVPLGFSRENVLLFSLNPEQAGIKSEALTRFYADLQSRFAAMPGVRNVSFSKIAMASERLMPLQVSIPEAPTEKNNSIAAMQVGPSFFTTMKIPLLLGREIDERDTAGARHVAVVNEMFVKRYFGSENPMGRHFRFALPLYDGKAIDVEIIGVSRNARDVSSKRELYATAYMPYSLVPLPSSGMTYEVRAAGNPLAFVKAVRRIVHDADPRIAVSGVNTQAAVIDQTHNQERTFAMLCTGFALLGLLIACIGIYGTVAYSVARRTQEIGIRMALGAQPGRVLWTILRQVILLAAVGLAIGLPIAFATSHLIRSFLFGLKPNDPVTLAIAIGILLAAAVVAGYAPARRASRIDPAVALRHE